MVMYNRLSPQTCRNDKEQRVFQALLQAIPSLERRLLASSDEEVSLVADLVCLILSSNQSYA